MNPYDFTAPSVIRFGDGRASEAGMAVRAIGRHAWLLTGGGSFDAPGGPAETIMSSLEQAAVHCQWIGRVHGEPTVPVVADIVRGTRRLDAEDVVIVAVGGGAVIDTAKAVAAVALVPESDDVESSLRDRLEGIGRGMPTNPRAIRSRRPDQAGPRVVTDGPAADTAPEDVSVLPIVAIPTTAGTGAEATRNAVIGCPENRIKRSIRSPLLVPRAAIVDPSLTATCGRDVATWCGMDCLTQLIEGFITRFRRPIPRALVAQAFPDAMRGLQTVVAHAGQREVDESVRSARGALSHAALLSGLALANAGLGLAHGVAAALGGAFDVPHGLACAVMLPIAVQINRSACETDFAELERLMDPSSPGNDARAADRFVGRIESLCDQLAIPRRLSPLGIESSAIEWLARNSGGSSMRGNPVELTTGELADLLARVL